MSLAEEIRDKNFRALRASLPESRREVLEALMRLGSGTGGDVAQALGRSVLSVRPRLTELKEAGLIEEVGVRRTHRADGFTIRETVFAPVREPVPTKQFLGESAQPFLL
jgi:DNA-binding Lrp family transcriptional regulator